MYGTQSDEKQDLATCPPQSTKNLPKKNQHRFKIIQKLTFWVSKMLKFELMGGLGDTLAGLGDCWGPRSPKKGAMGAPRLPKWRQINVKTEPKSGQKAIQTTLRK